MPQEIKTIEEFEQITKTKNLVIIHFWAEWNASDFTAKNILNELEMELTENVTFSSLNVDQENLGELIKNMGINNVPAFAYFKYGARLAVEVGLRTKEGLQDRINNYFFS